MENGIQKFQDDGFVSGGLQIRSMDDLSRIAKMLSMSGYFTDAKDAAQCGVKVLAGAELGFGAFSSMTGIHIIKGKPSIGAGLMASAVKRHPNYNYRVLEHSDQVCKIAFYEKWDGKLQEVGVSEFTLADAKRAQCQNLDKYARNMLFARAMSNGVRWYCPDVFDAPVYTPEELGGTVDGDGNYIDAEVSTVPPARSVATEVVEDSVILPEETALAAMVTDLVNDAKADGLTSADIKTLCEENNLPTRPSGFKTQQQVDTLAAELEDLKAMKTSGAAA